MSNASKEAAPEAEAKCEEAKVETPGVISVGKEILKSAVKGAIQGAIAGAIDGALDETKKAMADAKAAAAKEGTEIRA
jgi:hypothetical protein